MKYLTLMALLLFIHACEPQKPHSDTTPRSKIAVGDTIFLESGVKFLFTQMSEDTVSVDSARRLSTHINLYIGEERVWTTREPVPQVFPVKYKVDNMIAGFDEVLSYMKKGDRITAIIPPEHGYGAVPYGSIPANSVLNFDIEVLDIR